MILIQALPAFAGTIDPIIAFDPNPEVPPKLVAQILHQASIDKASVCQKTDRNIPRQKPHCPFQHLLVNLKTHAATAMAHHTPHQRTRPRYCTQSRTRQNSSHSIEVSSIKVIADTPHEARAWRIRTL
jgi:hypothetical protein